MPITKLGTQLIKEAARWMDFIQKLSPANRNRIFNSGIVKSPEEILSGIEKGTDNIVKRYGYVIGDIEQFNQQELQELEKRTLDQLVTAYMKKDKIGIQRNREVLEKLKMFNGKNTELDPKFPRDHGGASTDESNRAIHVKGYDSVSEASDSLSDRFLRAMTARHEAYEAQAIEKAYRRYAKNPVMGDIRARKGYEKYLRMEGTTPANEIPQKVNEWMKTSSPATKAIFGNKNSGIMCMSIPDCNLPMSFHANMSVLSKERKLFDRFPYQDNPGYKYRQKLRNNEYEYMDAAGKYNHASKERFGKVNNKELMGVNGKPIQIGPFTYQAMI